MSGALSTDTCGGSELPSLTIANLHNFMRIRQDASLRVLAGIVQVLHAR